MPQIASKGPYTKGLHDLGNGCYAYLQPDGSWGWSNAGLVVDSGESLLVDTLFDLKLTAEMLEAMRRAEPKAMERIGTSILIPTVIIRSAISSFRAPKSFRPRPAPRK